MENTPGISTTTPTTAALYQQAERHRATFHMDWTAMLLCNGSLIIFRRNFQVRNSWKDFSPHPSPMYLLGQNMVDRPYTQTTPFWVTVSVLRNQVDVADIKDQKRGHLKQICNHLQMGDARHTDIGEIVAAAAQEAVVSYVFHLELSTLVHTKMVAIPDPIFQLFQRRHVVAIDKQDLGLSSMSDDMVEDFLCLIRGESDDTVPDMEPSTLSSMFAK